MSGARLTEDEKARIVTSARNGVSEADIVRLTRRSRGAVRRAIAAAAAGMTNRRKRIDVDPDRVRHLYEVERLSVRGVATALSVSYGTAHALIRQHCRMRPVGVNRPTDEPGPMPRR